MVKIIREKCSDDEDDNYSNNNVEENNGYRLQK